MFLPFNRILWTLISIKQFVQSNLIWKCTKRRAKLGKTNNEESWQRGSHSRLNLIKVSEAQSQKAEHFLHAFLCELIWIFSVSCLKDKTSPLLLPCILINSWDREELFITMKENTFKSRWQFSEHDPAPVCAKYRERLNEILLQEQT